MTATGPSGVRSTKVDPATLKTYHDTVVNGVLPQLNPASNLISGARDLPFPGVDGPGRALDYKNTTVQSFLDGSGDFERVMAPFIEMAYQYHTAAQGTLDDLTSMNSAVQALATGAQQMHDSYQAAGGTESMSAGQVQAMIAAAAAQPAAAPPAQT